MKTKQRKVALFEFVEAADTKECIDFITKYLLLLRHHMLGFGWQIDKELQEFLESNNLSFAILSGEIPTRDNASYVALGTINANSTQERAQDSINGVANTNNMMSADNVDSIKSESIPVTFSGAFSRTLWISRIVRSGEEIYHNGDIVIESHINSGARVVAEGNLFLFGECRGSIEAHGDFIICSKILNPAVLFQDTIVSQEILHTINQSNALFKMIFKKGDNILVKEMI